MLLKKALGTITGIGNLLNESVEAVDIIDRRRGMCGIVLVVGTGLSISSEATARPCLVITRARRVL